MEDYERDWVKEEDADADDAVAEDDAADDDADDAADDDVNSVDTIPEEEKENIAAFEEALQQYKKDNYERLLPDREDGVSQTDEPVQRYQSVLNQDANLLLRGDDEEREEFLSAAAKEWLLPYFTRENTHNEFIHFLNLVRLALITFPFARTTQHAMNLMKNENQE